MKNTSDATHTRVTSKEVTLTLDQDLSRMEDLLDTWTADLKRNVLVGELIVTVSVMNDVCFLGMVVHSSICIKMLGVRVQGCHYFMNRVCLITVQKDSHQWPIAELAVASDFAKFYTKITN